MFGFIYLTTNLVNGKIYIGQHEFTGNLSVDNNYLGSGVYLKRAIKKYGRENFKREILRECKTKQELNNWEKIYIRRYKSQRLDIGYNIADGDVLNGRNNPMKIPEVREKVKQTIRNLIPHISEVIKAQFQNGRVASFKGKHHSEETKLKISKSRIGKYTGKDNPNYGNHKIAGENNSFFGKRHTKKSIKKNSMAHIGKISITNGVLNKMIDSKEPIPLGWRKGRTINKNNLAPSSKPGRRGITNGKINKWFYPGETMPEGFYFGMTKRK